MKASDLFVQCLENEGVEYVFGVPGEENLDLLESLRKSRITVIPTRHEQSAVFMAATWGRFTGCPGVALATLGPGATNMMTGVGYAQLNGFPAIVITGQKPIRKSKQGAFQLIDVVSMMQPLTKFTAQVQSGNRITSVVREAFKIAIAERPGVSHLELPEDIAKENVTGHQPLSPRKVRRPEIEEKAFAQLVELLEEARRPIILIGAGANRKRVTRYLTQFIEKYNIPFFESQMGKGVVDERLPQYVGTAALSEGDGVHKVIKKADLILAVGHDVIEKPTNFVSEGETRTAHLNFYEANVNEVYTPEYEFIGDLGNLFWQLCQADLSCHWDHKEMVDIARREFATSTENEKKERGRKVPRRFVRELRECLDEEDILALDNGWYKIWIARNYKTYHPNTLLLDNTFASMGAGMSSGTAAKMLNPDNRVVVVTGDGGLLMNLGDLETAVRLGNQLIIIVINNNSYGMIRLKQEEEGFPSYGLDLPNPDFQKLARSFGARGYKVEAMKDFKATMQKAFRHKGVSLIEVGLEYPPEVS